jgi:hypothetical protein
MRSDGKEALATAIGGSAMTNERKCQSQTWRRWACLLAVLLVAGLCVSRPAAAQDDTESNPGTNVGNYNVKQSIDLGYRYANVTGSNDVYDTFVNLGSGFRLLNESLDVRSLNHHGSLFDNLHLTNFGYGGDPNSMTRLSIDKNNWYEFTGLFRRDKYFWDYNLLANPFNPLGFTQITNSPHGLDLVHRYTDLNLILRPQARFRIRLGYTRNIEEGPAFTTSEGESVSSDLSAVPQLFQNFKSTVNGYHFGFDYKYIPRTVISYDQFFQYIKQDTSGFDNNLTFQLSNGTPVDLGIVYNSSSPCKAPIENPNTVPPTAYEGCAGTLSYTQAGRPRISMPTEQISFVSSYFKNIEMSGHFNYSSSDMAVNDYSELFNGSNPRTLNRSTSSGGPASAQRISANGDFGITWQVTPKFRILDTARYYNWRIPGQWAFAVTGGYASFPLNPDGTPSLLLPPAQFSAATCPPPFTSAACPQHNSSSGPDVADGIHTRFLSENDRSNTLLFAYDLNHRFGVNAGYRYAYRSIQDLDQIFYSHEIFYPGPEFLPRSTTPASERGDCSPDPTGNLPAGCVMQADGSVIFSGLLPTSDSARNTVPINQHYLLFGAWTRPVDSLRINFDMSLLSADAAFTRISPRQQQVYHIRANYTPRTWLNLDTGINIAENRDNVSTVDYLDHNRLYTFTAVVTPNEKFSFQASYNYTDILSLADVCLTVGFSAPTGSIVCPSDPTGGLIGANSTYSDVVHFAYAGVSWKPIKRVSTSFGYSGTFTHGVLFYLNSGTGQPLALNAGPVGPLQYNYHQPWAKLGIELGRGISYQTSWNYYGYNEKQDPGLVGLRDFNGNLATFALRYTF